MEQNTSTVASADDSASADPAANDKEVTDHSQSTYDILGAAISDSVEPPNVKYSLSTLWDATEAAPVSGHAGLKPWPSLKTSSQDLLSAKSHVRSDASTASHPALRPKQSQSTIHYDSKSAPLSISQQTSASAMRDMGLRKGSPAVLDKYGIPLKSALKRNNSLEKNLRHDDGRMSSLSRQDSNQRDKNRFARFSNFFTRSNSGGDRTPQPLHYGRSSSAASQNATNYSRPGLSRQRSVGWDQTLQQFHEEEPTSPPTDRPDIVRQAKLAGGDVYEKAKIHIKRPPQGIKNWFDGVEISSDEDDLTPVELPANDALPSTFTQFRSDSERRRDRRGRTAQHQSKIERMLGQNAGRIPDSFHDGLIPLDTSRRHRHTEDDLDDVEDMQTPTGPASVQQRYRYTDETGRISAMSTDISHDEISELAGRSSTTDNYSSNSTSDVVYSRATAVNVARSPTQTRRLHSAQASPHVAERPRLVSRGSGSKNSSRRPEELEAEAAYRKLSSPLANSRSISEASRSRGRPSTRRSSSHGYDESSGGVALDHLPTDSARMMAVTEEEMALLEMMRNKRAAMQNNNFNEAHRRALQREHEQLMQRRLLAQQTALEILRSPDEQELRRQETDEEDIELIVDDKEIRRLNKLRQEEINRVLRLEKFLAMDTSMAAALEDAHTPHTSDSSRDRPARPVEKHSRKSTRTPSFNKRDIYQQYDEPHRTRSRHAEIQPSYFPSPPSRERSHRQSTSIPDPARSRSGKAHRESQQPRHYDKITKEEAYRMQKEIARQSKQSGTVSRKQMQAMSFLRSISDYQPTEMNSVTSQETPSVSASIISPLTPSSLGATQAEKHSSYGQVEHELDSSIDQSSPEQKFRKSAHAETMSALTKKKHTPTALAIVEAPDRRYMRNSMASSNSAGEDVLAAWAELGGGMLPSRRARV